MELVANVWPVFDPSTRLVLRFLMRAYAMEAPDEVISTTLRALAPTDFRTARAFPIPRHFVVTSPFGSLPGSVTLSDFHQHQGAILASAFQILEGDFATLQGVVAADPAVKPFGVGVIPRFPPDPYLLVTSVLETADGQLIPQLSS